MNNHELQLYNYHCWANGRMMDHLLTMPNEVFHKEIDLGFKSIAEVIGHLASADEVWLNRLRGVSTLSFVPKPFADAIEASGFLTELELQFRDFLATIKDSESVIHYKNTAGQQFHNTIFEILQHVVNHGTYHRGNMTTMLRALGYKGIQTDYIAFLRTREAY